MIRKLLLVSFIAILIFPLAQCDPDGFYEEIDLPFVQCTTGVSAASAIATWSAYDGNWASEVFLLSTITNPDGTMKIFSKKMMRKRSQAIL